MTECVLHKVHHPSVAVLHTLRIDGEAMLVCGTGMDNLRACVTYLRGGSSPAARIGRETWDLAQMVSGARKVQGL